MILRLKSRLVSGLIVSTIGMTGATFVSAVGTSSANGDTAGNSNAAPATSTPGTPSAGGTAAAPSTPSAGSPSSSMPGAASGSDTSMAPRGADPSATTNAMSGTGTADSPAKKIFDQLDLNHDGMLSLEEFSRATFQEQPPK